MFLHFRHFSGLRRFKYKEPAMNRIQRDDQLWVKKRPIMLPRLPHDINKYEMDDRFPTRNDPEDDAKYDHGRRERSDANQRAMMSVTTSAVND